MHCCVEEPGLTNIPAVRGLQGVYMKGDDPRDTLNEVLRNIHGSLKWYWQVVMGLSMVKAVDNLYVIWFEGKPPPSLIEKASFSSLFVAFLLIFIRFYFGDSRYLDEHYIEYRKWRPIPEYLEDIPHKISKQRTSLDVLMLMIIAILFVFMAKSLSHPRIFFVTYFALLVLNICWLCCTMYLNSNQRPTNIVKQERYDAPKIWIINNFINSFLMLPFLNIAPSLAILTTNQSVQHIVLLILCVTNSIFDFMLTLSYYFPRLDASHDQRLRGED